jgi:hypothetical protein
VFVVAPQVSCWSPIVTVHRSRLAVDDSHFTEETEEVKVELKCSIKANPSVSDADVHWIAVNKQNVSFIIGAGDKAGIFHALDITVSMLLRFARLIMYYL